MAATLLHLKTRNKNYRDKFMQGAKGADLERKQILEDQCRAVSENLFKKRRDLQQMQTNFDAASRELMDVKAEKNEAQKESQQIGQSHEAVDQDLNQLGSRIGRLVQSKDSKLNNARAVRGEAFDNSAQNLAIMAEIESAKSQYLLNAISLMLNDPVIQAEVPDLINEIQQMLAETDIAVPERPGSALERPVTTSSQQSGRR